jgi:hypothetical protein
MTMTTTTPNTITDRSLALFLAYADDASEWNGEPLVGGNVENSKEDRGNLTQLKMAGLIETFKAEGHVWLKFTDAGRALATDHGINIGEFA